MVTVFLPERQEKVLNLDEKAPETTMVQAFWIAVKEWANGTDRATDCGAVGDGPVTGVVETDK
jgi:hypothetical protein